MELKDIEKLAKLARIELSDDEKKSLLSDMERILLFVGQVSQAGDLVSSRAGGPEGSREMSRDQGLINVMRADENPHDAGVFTEKLLTQVPSSENGYVKVKKIL